MPTQYEHVLHKHVLIVHSRMLAVRPHHSSHSVCPSSHQQSSCTTRQGVAMELVVLARGDLMHRAAQI